MKAATFENLIRKVVREEIDYSLRREIKTLKEDLRSELKPTIVEHTERLKEIPKSSLREKIMGNEPVKQRSNLNFTSNSALNDLLNETARGGVNLETENSPVSLLQPFATGEPMSTDTTGMSSGVAEAVTRDYSDLMKAITDKKGR